MSSEPGGRRILVLLVKVAISLALLGWVASTISVEELKGHLAGADLAMLGLAAMLLVMPVLLTSVRLWILIRVAGVGLSLWRVFVITIVGNFFNIALPGLTGGDVPKAILMVRDAESKAEGIAMLVADRLIGAFSLLLLGSAAAITRLDDPELRQPGLTLLALAGVGIVGGIVYVAPPLRRLLRVDQLLERLPGGSIIARMDAAGRAVLRHPIALVGSILISLASHTCTVVVWVLIIRALGDQAPAGELFVYVPLTLVAASLPISFGGWGVRETVARELLVRAGTSPAVAVATSVLYQAIYTLLALPGGVLLLVSRARTRARE